MAIKSEREYRMVVLPDIQFRAAEDEEHPFRVEGYATTYDDPYTLYEYDGIQYKEEIDRDALAGADMSDVIFLYNHEGMVYARQSNGTLALTSLHQTRRVYTCRRTSDPLRTAAACLKP